MRCYKARKLIYLRLDNELDSTRSNMLDKHLSICPSCAANYQKAQKLDSMLKISPEAQLPDWIHHRILAATHVHDRKRSIIRRRNSLQAIPVTIAVMMSLYVGMLVGVNTFNKDTSASTTVEYVSFGDNTLLSFEDNSGGYNE